MDRAGKITPEKIRKIKHIVPELHGRRQRKRIDFFYGKFAERLIIAQRLFFFGIPCHIEKLQRLVVFPRFTMHEDRILNMMGTQLPAITSPMRCRQSAMSGK
jgi:hypothetical protein